MAQHPLQMERVSEIAQRNGSSATRRGKGFDKAVVDDRAVPLRRLTQQKMPLHALQARRVVAQARNVGVDDHRHAVGQQLTEAISGGDRIFELLYNQRQPESRQQARDTVSVIDQVGAIDIEVERPLGRIAGWIVPELQPDPEPQQLRL